MQESRAAKEIGGRVQKASGATDFAKGDVRKRGDLRLECKTTSKKSYVLKIADLKKIAMEALMGGEDWAFQIEFQGQAGQNKKFVVMDGMLVQEQMKVLFYPFNVFEQKSLNLEMSDLLGKVCGIAWTYEGKLTKYAVMPWHTYLELFREEES